MRRIRLAVHAGQYRVLSAFLAEEMSTCHWLAVALVQVCSSWHEPVLGVCSCVMWMDSAASVQAAFSGSTQCRHDTKQPQVSVIVLR